MSWFESSGRGKPVDVPTIMDSDCPTILWEIVQAGAMISLGTTSDGGALGVTVTLDGKWRREYFRETEDLRDWLLQAHEAVKSATDGGQTASAGPRKRARRS